MRGLVRMAAIACVGSAMTVCVGCKSMSANGDNGHAAGYTDAPQAGDPMPGQGKNDPVPNVPAGGMTVTPPSTQNTMP